MRAALIAAALVLAGCDYQEAVVAGSATRDGNSAGAMAPRSLPAFFDCLRENGDTIVSAHRGGSASGFAENAIPTFEHTLSQAPALLEVDVARTKDGVLVLMHDDDISRTTTGAGQVGDLDMEQLLAAQLEDDDGRRVDARVPTLREALEWADGRTVLELDVKRSVSYEDVAREVRDAGAMGRVVFITYSVDGASRLARVAPEAMIYTTITDARDLDTLQRRGVDLTHILAWLGDDALDRDLLEALNARGVEARWGLFDRRADFASAVEAGVQSVAVNDPAAAYRAIDAADGRVGYAAMRCVVAR